ncbi:hypothetical protein BKA83DRAFT_4127879 [Pisolithus microcarpus]|nr:hypothetical protein BKA83DRAFT_4127879 [Pisolithus microcarpus]
MSLHSRPIIGVSRFSPQSSLPHTQFSPRPATHLSRDSQIQACWLPPTSTATMTDSSPTLHPLCYAGQGWSHSQHAWSPNSKEFGAAAAHATVHAVKELSSPGTHSSRFDMDPRWKQTLLSCLELLSKVNLIGGLDTAIAADWKLQEVEAK